MTRFMKMKSISTVRLIPLVVALTAAAFLPVHTASAQSGYTGIFGGGPYYKNPSVSIPELEASGFTEAIVWSVEVNSAGDLNLNGEFPLTSNGVYIGDQTYPDFAANLATLKQGTVKRVTFSVGSSNFGDWEDITALVKAQGTGPTSILYKTFKALKTAIPALDAIDFDDENSYNAPTTIEFGVMLGKLGYHVVPDPYVNASYWINVVAKINALLPGTVDGVHLQAYAGGAGNTPCEGWNFGSVPVWPGLWDANYSPAQVQSIMTGWHTQCGINGGFMWLYDDFVGTGAAAQYATAINTAVDYSGFYLTATSKVIAKQGGTADALVTITDVNGFTGAVTLNVLHLPKGVVASVEGQGNKRVVVFKVGAGALPGTTPVTIQGISGSITELATVVLVVSAAGDPTEALSTTD